MALIARLARLWRADINALLDRLEAPDLVLAQSIREMEQALDTERRTLARFGIESERLAELDTGLAKSLDEAGSAVQASIAAGRDDLARAAIRRGLESERRRAALSRRRNVLTAERDTLARRVAARDNQLEELRARAVLVGESAVESDPAADGGAWSAHDTPEPWIRDEDVEIALIRAKGPKGAAS